MQHLESRRVPGILGRIDIEGAGQGVGEGRRGREAQQDETDRKLSHKSLLYQANPPIAATGLMPG
jgi:hypothetical protein